MANGNEHAMGHGEESMLRDEMALAPLKPLLSSGFGQILFLGACAATPLGILCVAEGVAGLFLSILMVLAVAAGMGLAHLSVKGNTVAPRKLFQYCVLFGPLAAGAILFSYFEGFLMIVSLLFGLSVFLVFQGYVYKESTGLRLSLIASLATIVFTAFFVTVKIFLKYSTCSAASL